MLPIVPVICLVIAVAIFVATTRLGVPEDPE